jgi:hypothetical protein
MEPSQGNSLGSYLYLKQAKMSCFSFYLYKTREQEGGTGSLGGVVSVGRGRWQGKE